MSRNINSMLEHLRVGPLKRIKVPSESNDDGQKQQQDQQQKQQEQQQPIQQASTATTTVVAVAAAATTTAATATTFDELSSTSSMTAKGNGSVVSGSDEVDNRRVSVLINDTRKKSLKEMPNGVVGIIEADKKFDPRKRYSISNGDLRSNGKGRELSPATMRTQQQRKLSADMRIRGSNNQLTDDYLLRRPVRLRSLCTNYEVYDSLHTKAMDVSSHLIKFYVLFIFRLGFALLRGRISFFFHSSLLMFYFHIEKDRYYVSF